MAQYRVPVVIEIILERVTNISMGTEILFQFIDKLGYSGWIGCEYKPAKSTLEGLGWIRPCL